MTESKNRSSTDAKRTGDHEPLFIVDNTEGGRNGLDYLSEWCDLASSLDIATGYFEIGALLALDGEWQKLDQIRILMGDEVSHRTKKAFLDVVTQTSTSALNTGLEGEKGANPFLTGAPAVVEALQSGQIEVRVYNKDKFHAKAYITHGKFDVVGSQALVGSSNFTVPGLTDNIELNIKVESGAEAAQLQRWYERHWNDAVDVTPEILKTVERHTREHRLQTAQRTNKLSTVTTEKFRRRRVHGSHDYLRDNGIHLFGMFPRVRTEIGNSPKPQLFKGVDRRP